VRHTVDYRRTPGFTNPEQQFAAAQNADVYGQQHQLTYGMTTRVVANWLHRRGGLVASDVADGTARSGKLRSGNNVVRPLVTYAVSDRRKIRFGAEYYSGPDLSYFGALKRNRTVFVELQQFF
jgi:hypothetical protein